MNSIQVADQTFIAADPADIGRAISNPADWRRWWPDLQLNVVEERGEKGIRWTVAGAVTGTMEVWLEPALDGAILHYFLHAEPAGVSAAQAAKLNLAKLNHARRIAGKRFAFGVKQRLEASRSIGESWVPQA
ncbi:polyketide cyclase / dehydrase and lipid transport [Mycobacteriaceae bacterium NPDC060252]